MATWNGFRAAQGSPEHLSLAAIESVAREIAGDAHHFRYVQLPVNLGMTEALTLQNQDVEGKQTTIVESADTLGIQIIASASLLQGRMARRLPPFIATAIGLEDDAQRALQFVRSLPGMTAALVGMRNAEHVRVNARALQCAGDDGRTICEIIFARRKRLNGVFRGEFGMPLDQPLVNAAVNFSTVLQKNDPRRARSRLWYRAVFFWKCRYQFYPVFQASRTDLFLPE